MCRSRRGAGWVLIGLVPAALAACASQPQPRTAAPSTQTAASARPQAAQSRVAAKQPDAGNRAADHALKMLNAPYRYGGSHPSTGFDCSGLIQFSYRQAGVSVPRSTDEQRRASEPIRLAELNRGDLVFFDQEGKKNSHLGIYVGNGRFVHAPSSGKRVRSDELSAPYWKKHISEVRRLKI